MKNIYAVKYIKTAAAIPFLAGYLIAGTAYSLPCNGESVVRGETMMEVSAKCGEAVLKEQRTVTVEEVNPDRTKRSTVVIDEWTYDRGPEESVQWYRFENGTLTDISDKGFGTMQDFSIDTCRNGELLAVGDSTVDAYLKCGSPIAKETLNSKIMETESNGSKRRTILQVAEWTYRYGPKAPGYTLTFENGIVAKIRMREFGQ